MIVGRLSVVNSTGCDEEENVWWGVWAVSEACPKSSAAVCTELLFDSVSPACTKPYACQQTTSLLT